VAVDLVLDSKDNFICLFNFVKLVLAVIVEDACSCKSRTKQECETTFPFSVSLRLEEHCSFAGSQISWRSDENSIETKLNMEQSCNDTDRGKLKYSEQNLTQCHFVHHTAFMD
jgi:hypothetical protein